MIGVHVDVVAILLHLEQRRQGILMEDMRTDLKKVLEIKAPSEMREEQFDRMEHRVEQHDSRISTLEMTVKDHLDELRRP
jgi:hypothetical protein